jgi:hypothetical protein
MVELFNGKPTWMKKISNVSSANLPAVVADIKKKMIPKKMCDGDALKLLPFVEEVFEIKFDEEPDY